MTARLWAWAIEEDWGAGMESKTVAGMMGNLHSQPDWSRNHLGDTHLGMSVWAFPEKFNHRGRLRSECGWDHHMARVLA